jgi:hypothetical protein
MLLICLDYNIRARDSSQIYAFAERLLAAKNITPQIRRVHGVLSVLLWPLWLLGFRFCSTGAANADSRDRWVSWAKNYLASHPKQAVVSHADGTNDKS